ncbi:hypothetical protein Q0M94_24705 (plasmid) [Deinococcus radiomollis]|uniref:Agd3-related carbohydrate-binding protein n=1 Tax=Deinococcus radiomollis TaxID=468916 RepID=UPI003891E059
MKRRSSLPMMSLLTMTLLACSRSPEPKASSPALTRNTSDTNAPPAMHMHAHDRPALIPDVLRIPNLNALPDLRGPKIQERALSAQAITANPNLVALRLLIITAGSGDPNLDASKSMLDQAGAAYDVFDATATPLTESTLKSANGSGRYEGIILTNNSLVFQNSSGGYQSAFTPDQWATLWQYEQIYQVRQLSMYTFPSAYPEDYGLRYINGSASASADIIPVVGQTVTSDLRSGAIIKVRNAYNYPASALSSSQWSAAGLTSVQPVLSDSNGRVFAATSTTTSGRERLALTMAHNQYFLHSQLLGYALLNWVTRGVYLGDDRRYNQVDIDDWFLSGDRYDAATKTVIPNAFRMSASDALATRDEQTSIQNTFSVARAFRFAIEFNGGGADESATASCDPNVKGPDPLTSVTRCLGSAFDWISHTRDHLYMDFQNYDNSYTQINDNQTIAGRLGLVRSTQSLTTGNMSGLGYYNVAGDGPDTNYGLSASNVNFLNAAEDANVAFVASNHSVSGQWDAACQTCGVVHPLKSSILLVPRWPTNMFYYATTPQEVTVSYNAVYAPGGTRPYWDHALTYAEILDKESDIALSHVLSGAAFPHYMHTANLYQYAPGRSVASDWVTTLLSKYSSYSTLPLNTLRWDDLGQFVSQRTSFIKGNVQAMMNRADSTVTITSASGGGVYATGLQGDNPVTYGNQTISFWDFSPNQTLTVSLK